MLKFVQSFSSNLKIRTKMIFLVSGIVLISVLPLSLIVLYRNQAVVLDKTFEVCRNLAGNIANLATEELLINETYDATRTALVRLNSSEVSGLMKSFVLNIDGKVVANMQNTNLGEKAPEDRLSYYSSLDELTLSELKVDGIKILQFIYPIFINYKDEKMRVGTAVFNFDKEIVYQPVMEIRKTIIVVSSILFLMGILVALIAAITFSKPIQLLAEGAKLIGQGDLSYRIPIRGKDEISQLATAFNHMTYRIQDFTQNLETMVVQRTDELNQTLQEVRALKEAQDGDYYLTSLLLEPLQFNNNSTKNTKTEFYVEQKKKFKFRKWESQIGGDICITDTITLNGREYTVFLNGDAMGKSIQGAGGALVFGVVFNSGIMRTRLERNTKTFPEIWLRERFLDIQNVFLSFEGSMYISVCMGLVDDLTGQMYYINAEHPWTILYRDGKAEFLEEELNIRKIGTPGEEEKFSVRMFQMMPGDVVFSGSDGRDDLMVTQESGEDVMNEDEYEILKRIEEASGNIDTIVSLLKDKGQLSDDLSLLRISYFEGRENELPSPIPYEVIDAVQDGNELVEKGKDQEALERIEGLLHGDNSYPDLLKLLGNIYFNKKEYNKALDCFLSYSELNPSDNEYIYVISNTYRLIGQLNEAADYGERLYLRDTVNYLNLLNLSAIYKDLGIATRSKYMADKAIAINPEARKILKIDDEIKEKVDAIIEFKVEDPEPVQEISLDVLVEKADEYYQSKQYRESMDTYLEYYNRDTTNPWVLFRLANCSSLLNELEEAVEYYLSSIEIAPRNHHAYNNLGSVYFKLKDYKKAKLSWENALQLKSDFKSPQINLTRLEKFEMGQLSKGLNGIKS